MYEEGAMLKKIAIFKEEKSLISDHFTILMMCEVLSTLNVLINEYTSKVMTHITWLIFNIAFLREENLYFNLLGWKH